MPMGLNISPSIWHSYINIILDCIQSRKYCEAIMDDLLLFRPTKKSHMDKLEDLIKVELRPELRPIELEAIIIYYYIILGNKDNSI